MAAATLPFDGANEAAAEVSRRAARRFCTFAFTDQTSHLTVKSP